VTFPEETSLVRPATETTVYPAATARLPGPGRGVITLTACCKTSIMSRNFSAAPEPYSKDVPVHSDDFLRSTVLGTLVGILSVGLCAALLLLLVFSQPDSPAGGGTGEFGSGAGHGDNSGAGGGASGEGLAATGQAGEGRGGTGTADEMPGVPSEEIPEPAGSMEGDGEKLLVDSETPAPTRRPVEPSTAASIAPVLPKSVPPRFGSGGETGDGESGEGGSEEPDEFMGVKVKGSIALVCDISGSMHADFPRLYQELRENFRRSTPIILVNGCHFGAPGTGVTPPRKAARGEVGVYAPDSRLGRDRYVYVAQNTTDAIIFSVEKLRRRTVMFNNDLQDGGSKSAIDAFRQLRRKQRFTLSGRSLNCDAPACLLDFIKSSGGDFKVDTINRTRAAAVSWNP